MMKYKPLYNPEILQSFIDAELAEDPQRFTDGTFNCVPRLITPVNDIEIDRYNFERMKGLIDLEELAPLWDDCVKRGVDKRTFILETLNFLGWDPEIEKALLKVLSSIDEKPIRKNHNKDWLLKNEAELQELYRKTGNALGAIRTVANSQGITDDNAINSLRGSANQINFLTKL